MMHLIRRPLFLAAFFVALISSPRAEFVVATEVGLGNSYKAGGWTPLRVELLNRTSPLGRDQDFNGQVQVTTVDRNGVGYQFAMPLELPIGGRKRIEIPVLLPDKIEPVTIRLVTERGRTVYSEQLMPNTAALNLDNQRQLGIIVPTVLLLASPNDTPSFLSTAADAANTRMIQPASMPRDYKSYDGVRLVVVRHAISGALEIDQINALDQWLRLGGRLLVIVPKAAADIRQDRWLGPRLPAPLIESREVALSELDPNAPADKILVGAWGDPIPGATILWRGKPGPLAIERPYGMGSIVALGVDPGMLGNTPLRAAVASFNESLVLAPSLEDVRARHFWETSNIMPFEDTIRLPNRLIVILIIAIFVIVVGPMNFSFLRRRRRLELAWVTIPALSILFFTAIYGYGVLSKGGRQQFGTAEIVHMSAGQPDGLLLWNAMQFSPKRQVYKLNPGAVGSIVPLLNMYDDPRNEIFSSAGRRFMAVTGLERGSGGTRGGVALAAADGGYELSQPGGQWEAIYYAGEQPINTKGTIDGEVTILGDGMCRVRVVNHTKAVLKDTVVRIGPLSVDIGQLNPEQKYERLLKPGVASKAPENSEEEEYNYKRRRMERKIKDSPGLGAWADTVCKMNENVYPNLELVHPQRRCRLMARQEAWVSQIKVDPAPDQVNNMAVIEVDLPVRLASRVGMRTGDDLLRREVYHFDTADNLRGSVGFGADGAWCKLDGAWVDVLFAPPRLDKPAKFVGGTIDIDFETHDEIARVSVYNYRRNDWDSAMEPDRSNSRRQRQINIRSEWVNPHSPMTRVRIEAAVQPDQRPGAANGLDIHKLEAQMVLEPDNAN